MFGPGTYRPDPTEGRGYEIQSHFFALSLPPPVSAGGRCWHAALVAPPARGGSTPPQLAQGVARQGAVWTGGGGWVTVERQGFTGGEGLGTTGLEDAEGNHMSDE